MSNVPQRFGWLAKQFEQLAHDLSACQDTEHRKQMLRKMRIVIDEADGLLMNEQLLDSERDSTAPSSPPLSKATLQ
jgi:hypothetical protein